ncbi:glucosamine-6-phosphate deaminase [Streptococcus sp. CSL10205-OR2]|uniref:glucosamine-6-phosphate deaminase n=1 Tax=Streptococcus sp. CSL10205-OR2 TaxID=2980558 RepID=UPI0021DAE39A|nr:glucosamine-6-phosphate deaminase [Streptococcus sp. CSL10205-OR2]MCU9533574.1 glucosamine-6-phosphate deaminase [Streptococcus sp. CSL10205-OR2]
MKIITVKDQLEGAQVAFDILKEKIENGAKTLGLATGSTPIELYNKMVASDLDFTDMRSVNLDEYVGLSKEDSQSYYQFMKEYLFDKKPFKESFLPDGMATDIESHTKEYDAILEKYPIDLQILGIGNNGHIGFNEPGTAFNTKTHLVDLKENTIKANARFFEKESDVPRQAISMGIASILKARTIILMAYGQSKADAIAKTVNGPVTKDVPASVLQNHKDVYVIVDEEAASEL